MKNQIVNEVNASRKTAGHLEFETVGVITGVTGGSELDPNLNHFHVSKAFYWEDYFSELLRLFQSIDSYRSLTVEFAGGGSIVTKQIAETQAAKLSGLKVKIKLFEGISDQQSLSATDLVIKKVRDRTITSHGLEVFPLQVQPNHPSVIAEPSDCKNLTQRG